MTVTDAFPHRLAGHCGSGALRSLLEHRGLDLGAGPLSEGMVFGLGGGLGFLYAEVPGMRPPIYMVGRTAGMEEDISDHLGLGLELVETDDPDEGWAVLRAELDAGAPTMVWADIGHLEYLRVKMHNTRHDIVVVAYDEDEGVAWIADNDRDELQRCSLESLARARSSDAFPGPNRHRVFRYRWPERLPEPATAIRAAIARAVENMTGHVSFLEGVPSGGGLRGVASFAEAYPQWPARFGDDLDLALGGLRVFVEKAGTGGAMFRSLHAEFLHDAAALLDDEALRAAAALYDELAGTWRALGAAAGERDHAAGLELVETIAALERDGVQRLSAWELRRPPAPAAPPA